MRPSRSRTARCPASTFSEAISSPVPTLTSAMTRSLQATGLTDLPRTWFDVYGHW